MAEDEKHIAYVGTMVIDGVTINAIDSNGGAGVWNDQYCELTVKNGTFTAATGQETSTTGSGCISGQPGSTIVIEKGTFTSLNNRCYAINCYGATLTINDANVDAKHGAIAVNYGSTIINGGTYEADNYYGIFITNDDNSTLVTINDGVFKGGSIGKVGLNASVDDGNQDEGDVTITINGGSFDGPDAAIKTNTKLTEHVWVLAVKGGTFTSDPSLYVAAGFEATENAGIWTVNPVK